MKGNITKFIKKYLLLQDLKLEKKWWHRLAKVLIYISTIGLFVFLILISSISLETWKKYEYGPFNFEIGYEEAKGNEVKCFVNIQEYSQRANIKCNNKRVDEYIFVESFFINDWLTEQKFNYDKYLEDKEKSNNIYYDSELLKPLYQEYFQDKKIQAKENIEIQYSKIAKAVFIPFLITTIWFLFWVLLVYQSIIYIVFGKDKK